LILLLTDRLKASYSYPGFELGYFKRSIQARKFIKPGLERFVIPFCIGTEIPNTMHYIQGIKINKQDIYGIAPDGDKVASSGAGKNEQVNSVYKLFDRIAKIASDVSNKNLSNEDAIRQNMLEAASELYKYRLVFFKPTRHSAKEIKLRR
jgi:hypothetical protein